MQLLSESIDLLERLIAFPTISRSSNHELVDHVAGMLESAGISVEMVPGPGGSGINLWASTGPRDQPGVVLSGHSDVVPVEGQAWSSDPFRLTRRGDRLYGRGTADMKGFIACAVSAMIAAAREELRSPLHLALSCDEEIGCVGVRALLDILETRQPRPLFVLIGEPTLMGIATGHKGKLAARATITGRAAHSALAPSGLNAILLAAELIRLLEAEQARLEEAGVCDADYEVPYSTVHIGMIAGGTALNIVPEHCQVDFEIRTVAGENAEAILERIVIGAEAIAAAHRHRFPEAAIRVAVTNAYPGLEMSDDPALAMIRSLTGANATTKVSFGTEGGLFHDRLGSPTLICGPGSMAQGHNPDEFVTIDQLTRCCAMLERLIDRLVTGAT